MVTLTLDPQQAVILIPSLEPDDRLPAYVAALRERGFAHVVVVDDGSAESYQPIFSCLDAMDGCQVLHHEVNRGKGVALKTGYAHIQRSLPEAVGVITADADGQHTVEDCWKLAQALCESKDALYLGSRDFGLAHVPPKSRWGNRITSGVFRMLYGQWLPDTQTGLRAFPARYLPFMQEVEGDRFEYEMNVLIACARAGIPMIPVTIETIYENENAGTHFHPIRDSYRIYKVILGSFIKFMGASILSFLIDQGVFALMENVVLAHMGTGQEIVSTVVARAISAPCNFLMNKSFVFKAKNSRQSFLRYIVLAVGLLLVSAVGVELLVTLLHFAPALASLVKLVVDTLLYLVSYRIQNRWVFPPEEKEAVQA